MLISQEPILRVGIVDHRHQILGEANGRFVVDGFSIEGSFRSANDGGSIVLTDASGQVACRGREILLVGEEGSTFTLHGVTIGVDFHWERTESQVFRGDLQLVARDGGTIAAINLIPLEEYLASVASSEMNQEAPQEFLKAHAIVSRSWLVAMLRKDHKEGAMSTRLTAQGGEELIRWYDREDHDLYDVCADDHCQRYQGIGKIAGSNAHMAVVSTRGVFLVHDGGICDARFSKACGGLTECYENCWEDTPVPYLQSVPDSHRSYAPVLDEQQAKAWITASPDAYCNTTDQDVLNRILTPLDRGTRDFFRWEKTYRRGELEEVIHWRSGVDFGTLMDLAPVQRGPSGRIVRLRIQGTGRTLIVGKELEIRRWLSPTHLHSSAFVVETMRDASGIPQQFTLRGCGWGHGVGMCQIGAAVMAIRGKTAEETLAHYYPGTERRTLYS